MPPTYPYRSKKPRNWKAIKGYAAKGSGKARQILARKYSNKKFAIQPRRSNVTRFAKNKTAKWSLKNPIGDRLRAKIAYYNMADPRLIQGVKAYTFGGTLTAPILLNDPYAWVVAPWTTNAPASKGSFLAAQRFKRYKVTGVKITWRPRINSSGVNLTTWDNSEEMIRQQIEAKQYQLIVRAGSYDDDQASMIIDPRVAKEDKYSKVFTIAPKGQKQKPLSIYFPIKQLASQLNFPNTIGEYTGLTSAGNPSGFSGVALERPTQGPRINWGIARADSVNNPSSPPVFTDFDVQVDVVWYIMYFDPLTDVIV